MRQRDELPNPYASTLPADGAEDRSVAFHYLLASAVTAGVVVGGALAAGGSASADTAGTVTAQEDPGHGDGSGGRAEPQDTGNHEGSVPRMRLVANPDQPARPPTDPVGPREADEFVRGVVGSLAQDRAGLDTRIAAIHASAASPHPSPALPGASREGEHEQGAVWARKQLSRAEESVHGLWLPASNGILDFAGSIAATAVQLDAPAGLDLVASPALAHADGVRVSKGRELLEWGADWVDRMAEDLVDTIDAMLDRIELRIVGRSAPARTDPADGRSPMLSVVGSEPRSGTT